MRMQLKILINQMHIELLIVTIFIKNFYLCLRTINIVDIVADGGALCIGVGLMMEMVIVLCLQIDLSVIISIYR